MHRNTLFRRLFTAVFLGLVLVCAAKPQPGDAVQVLEAGQVIQDVLAPDQTTSFLITVSPGQYQTLTIEETDLGLKAQLFDPDGFEEITVGQSQGTGEGVISLSLLGSFGGSYRLNVSRQGKTGGEGRYRLSMSEARAARPEDDKRVTAEKAYAQAEQLADDSSAEALHQRLTKYATALQLWQQIADSGRQAACLAHMGEVYYRLHEPEKALEYLNQALPLSRTADNKRVEAGTLNILARIYASHGEFQRSFEYEEQALALFRTLKNRVGESTVLNNIGVNYERTGESAKALQCYMQVLAVDRALEDRRSEALALNNIGTEYYHLGEPQKALEYLQQGLEVVHTFKDPYMEAAILVDMGAAYDRLGEPQKALDNFQQSLSFSQTVGDSESVALALNNIGFEYMALGEMEKALDFLHRALTIRHNLKDQRREAQTLTGIGSVHSKMGETETALHYYQEALPLARAVSDREGEADVLIDMGDVTLELEGPQKALDFYNQALALYQSVGNIDSEAGARNSLGSAYLQLGEGQKSLEYLNQALQQTESTGDQSQEAMVLYELARAEQKANHLTQALARVTAALDLTEHFRGALSGSDIRTSYLASVRERYELQVALLMQLHHQRPAEGFAAKALEASERARARGLLDLLTESHADIRQGVEPAMLERERSLQEALRAKAGYRIQLLSQKHTEQQAGDLEKEINTLTTEYEETERQIRERSPRYASLTQPQPLTLAEIQHLLDPNTALLEYWLGEEGSFLWVVTGDSLESYSLPKRAEIEAAARQAYTELSVNNPETGGKFTAALSRVLLRGVEHSLLRKRLVIVAEGAVQYIPFAALRTPQGIPLISGHEIVNLPSASTLAVLRREMEGRNAAPRQVAVLADPVFNRNDPRVTGGSAPATPQEGTDTLVRSAKESGLLSLDRLPATRLEAEAIVAQAGKDSSLQALDFDASRQAATSPELGQYRIVHIASHTLLNSRHPELSDIILSLVDQQGRPQDGFLQSHEIFNLKLNADLVVLSACETALGKEVQGEGLIGLTRAFMYAGAPRVVASLWRVPDRATAELMKQFYAAMLGEGLPPAAALRKAQLTLSKERRWSAPYYWAAFTLQGEWK